MTASSSKTTSPRTDARLSAEASQAAAPKDAVAAVGRALLYTFQLSDKDYQQMRAALSELAFIQALEQDGWRLSRVDETADPWDVVRKLARGEAPPRLVDTELARLIVSYADLTHDVVQRGGDWREIADEWAKVVEKARNLLGGSRVDETPHPDAGNLARNHYDWFMPDNPTADVDANLDAFEAKMREALTDPFVHDMAHSVLPLIAAYRALSRVDETAALRQALRRVTEAHHDLSDHHGYAVIPLSATDIPPCDDYWCVRARNLLDATPPASSLDGPK